MCVLLSKTVHILYFASLREKRGLSEESFQTAAATPLALYQELRAIHGFTLKSDVLKVAVNDEFQTWRVTLKSGDRIAFLPPMAGG